MAMYLIRHGETRLNAARVVQTPETPLSRRGLEQADLLGRRLTEPAIAAILSSDLRRAAMTAERIRAATGAPLEIDALLQERNYGEVRGRPYSSLNANILDPCYDPPGGEDWNTFHGRVDRIWERLRELAAATCGDLAVVTHGLVLHSLSLRHLRLPDGTATPIGFANASLTIVDSHPPWAARLINCTAHLAVR